MPQEPGVKSDAELAAEDWKSIGERFKEISGRHNAHGFSHRSP